MNLENMPDETSQLQKKKKIPLLYDSISISCLFLFLFSEGILLLGSLLFGWFGRVFCLFETVSLYRSGCLGAACAGRNATNSEICLPLQCWDPKVSTTTPCWCDSVLWNNQIHLSGLRTKSAAVFGWGSWKDVECLLSMGFFRACENILVDYTDWGTILNILIPLKCIYRWVNCMQVISQ